PWQDILNSEASHKTEQSVNQATAAKMADWNVTVPINLPLNTIMAINNGEGIEAALSELAASGLEGHAVVQDVARAVIDTVNGSVYRITSNGKATVPPATYSPSPTTTDRECEAYDHLSTLKGSILSQQTPRQQNFVEYGEPCPPKKINIFIRSTSNNDQHFRVGLYATIESLFNLYIDQKTVSGNFSGLRFGDWSWIAGCSDIQTIIKEAGLKNGDVLFAIEGPTDPVIVTFKDAMLRTHIFESQHSEVMKTLLLSYADDAGLDFESLIFAVNGEWELREADYAMTLRDCGVKNGDLIAVRPRGEEPKHINIVVQDPLGHQYGLKIREDAETATLRSQYEIQIGPARPGLRFRFQGHCLKDGVQLRRLGIGEGSSVQVNLALPVRKPESAALIGQGSYVQVNRALPVPEPAFAAPSCPPTSPSLFASSRVLSNSYVPAASSFGWDYTPCRRSRRGNESGWD
ncbi:hypothetical protein KC336_g20156, partial [Hortaea werneckii]